MYGGQTHVWRPDVCVAVPDPLPSRGPHTRAAQIPIGQERRMTCAHRQHGVCFMRVTTKLAATRDDERHIRVECASGVHNWLHIQFGVTNKTNFAIVMQA